MLNLHEIYIAVRSPVNASYEWLDTATASASRAMVETKVDTAAKVIPEWHKANPVVRVGKFNLTEIE